MKQYLEQTLENLRIRLSYPDALGLMAFLGILSGLVSGLVIILFRLFVENGQLLFLNQNEGFESLGWGWRLLLPIIGAVVIGIIFQIVARSHNIQVGVVHVMERLAYHQGRLPIGTTILQFIGAGLSIISGHSVGREGPSIHLGAAAGSLTGQAMKLPYNSIRTLVACGTAAAIAAAFNTPLAGVIFAMEVVMMEYTLIGFTPVILAAVSATALTRAVFGSETVFSIPVPHMGNFAELAYVLVLGGVIGILAALFISMMSRFSNLLPDLNLTSRFTLAGVITGLCAVASPEIMGVGYDTVNQALLGQIGIQTLIVILLFKMLATTAGLGLGLPGGLIAPTLFIGAAAGGLLGHLSQALIEHHGGPAFYALLGMGAMMGATLQAPLAALTAMLELTASPNILLPGMLAVITAGLTSSELFGKKSIYLELIQARGLDYRNDPVAQSLRRTAVAGVMDRNFAKISAIASLEEIQSVMENKPTWLLLLEEQSPKILMPAADLAHYLENNEHEGELDLRDIPADRKEIAPVFLQATLQEAMETLTENRVEAVYVQRFNVPGIERIYGVLTRETIEAGYR